MRCYRMARTSATRTWGLSANPSGIATEEKEAYFREAAKMFKEKK